MEQLNYKLTCEEMARTKLKCELRKLSINFYFSENQDSLEKKLAYARNHQPPFIKRILKKFYK